jgi:branched-chain amino acid aminotransferase
MLLKQLLKANDEYVPPYESGGSLYLRPLLIGVGDVIGVQRAKEYIFTVFAMPAGNYFKGGLAPTKFIISRDFDRAAPHGTGAAKVGGNYAASLLPGQEAHDAGYSDVIYLDPSTHTKIEKLAQLISLALPKIMVVTPLSPSILPSITKYSLLYLAEHRLGLKAYEGDVYVDDLEKFVEAGACGTAVISPIGGIQNGDDYHVFYSETEVGPITHKLYDELVGIQKGDVAAPEGWIYKVDIDS